MALDLLELAVVAVDEARRVVYLNRAADELLAQRCWTVKRGDLLVGCERRIQSELDRLLEAASRGECAGGLFRLPNQRANLHVLAVASGQRTILVAFNSSAARWGDAVLAEVLGLTPAEARLAQSLMAGKTLRQHARAARISEATARSHLRHLLAKAGVPRQVELAGLLARLSTIRHPMVLVPKQALTPGT